jgi:hypothetical protein
MAEALQEPGSRVFKAMGEAFAEEIFDRIGNPFNSQLRRLRDSAVRCDVERDEAFHGVFREAVDLVGVRPLAAALDLGTNTVRRYAVGLAKPHPIMRRMVLNFLVKDIDEGKFTEFRTEEDKAYEVELAKPRPPHYGW